MKKKLAICQLGDKEYCESRQNSLISVKNYCDKHGYSHYAFSGTMDKDTHLCYQKPLLMLEHIDEYEYVGFLDIDIAITNRAVKIYELFKSFGDQQFFVTGDPCWVEVNSGSVWVKSNDYTKKFLEAWWDSRYVGVDEIWREHPRTQGEDQGRLIRLLKRNKLLYNTEISAHYTNIFPKNYRRGDWLIHFMGHFEADYEPFVEFANKNISDKESQLLDIYWLLVSRNIHSKKDRSYELIGHIPTDDWEDVEHLNIPYHSPMDAYVGAKQVIESNIPFFMENKGPLYGKFV